MNDSIRNWTIFLVVVSVLIVGMYYIFKNSAIGQLFSDVFGLLDSGAAAMDDKIKECEDAGFFSIKCGIGILGIVAGIGFVLFGVVKFLAGPAGDTKMGELWRSAKGTSVTTADLNEIKAAVDVKVTDYSTNKNTEDKWDDLTPEGQELFRKVATLYETHVQATSGLGNDPASQSKKVQLTNERNIQEQRAVEKYTDNQEPNEPDDGEDIAGDAAAMYGE
jgi:hypothetical protein